MSDLPEFKEWPSIPRLKGSGFTLVTEKIDGTNAIVHVSEDGLTVTAGSRSRWITPEADNYGFARWVAEHAEELRELGPGYHYGEWWGAGIQRRYGMPDKRFSLFNVQRWEKMPPPACCLVVPVLARLDGFDTSEIQAVADGLRKTGSVAAPGFMNPEGIVIFHPRSKSLFKYTLDGDVHKSAKLEQELKASK